MAALKQYGVDARHMVRLAIDASVSNGEIPTASKLFRDVDRLGDLANEWTENPAYVDSTGRPKVLNINGRGTTFATLVRKYFGNRSVTKILEMGCNTRLLERVGKERVAQFGGCVMFTGHPVLMLVHAIHSVRWFLTTTVSNAGFQSPSVMVLPDRRACTAIPKEDLREFIATMRQPVISLVEMGNRWLTARAALRRKRKVKKITMGVHAYLFRDPETLNGRVLGAASAADHQSPR
jgi:hypothetical protein